MRSATACDRTPPHRESVREVRGMSSESQLAAVGLTMSVNTCTSVVLFFFFQAEDGIRDVAVTGVQTCALPIYFLERQVHAAGARALTVPDRRRSDFAAVRLPRATGIVAQENRTSVVGNSPVLTAGRPRDRTDEQIAGLRTAGRRHGHGRSQ